MSDSVDRESHGAGEEEGGLDTVRGGRLSGNGFLIGILIFSIAFVDVPLQLYSFIVMLLY